MANHGAKFVSVNLNKSYGQQNQHSHHTHYPYSNGGGASYGQAAAAGRGRAGSGGGGGMVVLSRNRGAAAKAPAGWVRVLGLGVDQDPLHRVWAGPNLWQQLQQCWRRVRVVDTPGVDGMDAMDGVTRGIGSYMPPSARPNGVGVVGSATVSQDIPPSAEKPMVLRGEDFPTLQAARPVSSGTSQKQKDGLNQKQKQATSEELTQDKRDSYHLGPLVDMNPQCHSSRNTGGSRLLENGGEGHGMGSGQMADQVQKQDEYFPDPLPLVHMNPRSDWADDERDTGHVIVEQGRDIGFSNNESYWDRDFDLPRPTVLPHKPAQNQYDKWGQRDNETGKSFSSEVLKMDTYNKDARAPSREGDEVNKWRSTPPYKDSFNSQAGSYRAEVGARMAGHNNMLKENKYIPPRYGDAGRDGSSMLNQDFAFGRRDLGLAGRQQQQQQQRHNAIDSFNRGAEHNSRDRHVTEQPTRYRGDNFRNNTLSKSSFASGGKMAPMTDPILTMGRDKRFSKSERPFSDDPFMRDFTSAGFDETDLFPGELERVQKMQELERQRIVEEQEKALEQARREEEERQRRIREEEERQRRLEEEAREAAWRAEQERLEAIRRAEEQRIAREEEKRRIQLEEERRKQAAKQMLQELEARMAKRQAEATKGDSSASKTTVDEKLEAAVKEKHTPRNLDSDTWEDGERMVENVMNSGSFDSSAHSRPVEMSLRPYPPREGPSNFLDRGKAINSWRRDVFENGFPSPLSDQETGHYSPRRDAFGGGKASYRKEFNGAGYMPSRAYLKPRVQEQYPDEFGYHKDHGWNLPGNAESYGKVREIEQEFNDSVADKYGDSGWGQGHLGNMRPPYPERLYPQSEANELYSHGRSRYSMRQPRVLPPPSLASSQRTSFRGVTERSGPSAFPEYDIHYTHAARTESTRQTTYYGSNQVGLEPSEPPTSPPHLSHDELDESGDSPLTSAVAEEKRSLLTGSGSVVHNGNSGNTQQEEYDEDEDGYREEDEVREADENLELNQKFEGLGFEERESPDIVDNVVLGFDEGVEVVIPSDDFEKNSGTEERGSGIPDTAVGVMDERRSSDGFPSNEHSLLPSDDSHGTNADSSFGKVPEKSPLQGSIGQHTPYSSATADLLDSSDSSNSTGLGVQQTVSSSNDVMASTSQTNTPSLSSAGSQGDLPVKLQFGLFSGPSLIPSPVPAIQIGSIQMPLHIHPPVGPSITHMHPSQPPMFQFGQLHYSSPISQGVLPMAPQSMSFLQPNILGQFNLTQNAGGSMTHEPARVASTQNVTEDNVSSLSMNKQPSFVSASSQPEQSTRSLSRGLNTVLDAERHKDNSVAHSSSVGVSGASDNKMKSESVSQAEEKGRHHAVSKTYLPLPKVMGSESQSQPVQPTTQSVAGEKNLSGLRGLGVPSGVRGKRFAYAVKNANMKSSMQDHDMPADSNGFQRRPRRTVRRTEFRVRNDRRPTPASVSSKDTSLDDKPNSAGKAVGVFTRSGSKRGTFSNRTMKQRIESEPLASGNIISQEVKSEDREAKEMAKNLPSQTQNTSHPGEVNLRRNALEEDVDAPLQSGVVRVFKQPGIETPSDEDDFIEVRSKRQMLNDRREQREKEIKAKSRTSKPPSKPRATRQKVVVPRSHNKLSIPLASEEPSNSQLDFTASRSPHFGNNVESVGFTAAVSKPQIGITPTPVNSEAQPMKPSQARSVSVVSNGGTERDPGPIFDSKNKVMSLSQTQIDEAMKPARYDSHISAGGGHSSTASDAILPTASILTKEKTFSSGASPINSLLAGEKIQFGAVTSPTVLPPSSRVVSNTIGAPGSNRPDVQMSRSFPVPEKDNSLFFEKEKHLSDSCVPLQDCEAEEAAASAVAVAAISNDEIAGNGLAVNDTKSFVGADIDSITTGVVGDQHLASRSRGEELLSVSLPADLSVETTQISLWPPLPSPQSSSSQMLSHFPGGPPSHFPFYEMNPLLGGPIFAFSPHDESSGTQSQPQKSTPSSSAPLGNWQQCHSGVDSFYGPPAGYSGPFIGPPGGIPGVQGPPHMVVYNHFAPVGQYGQVGLSFMGTTYIPSGKQADWKNNPTSSAMHIGEGDINNMNMTNVQRNAPNMTAPVQHLAPGSPLLPMPSPLPMFDKRNLSFQTASDLPVQARWGHIPASPLHSVPVSRPSHPQGEGAPPSQVNGHSIDQSLTAKRFTESRTPTPSDNSPSFTVAPETNVAPFSSELGLVDSGSLRSTSSSSGQNVAVQNSSGSANAESSKTDTVENGKHQSASSVKTQFSQKSTQQGNTAGYNYQRGAMSHRNSTGNEWSHRRMGFHGRIHSTSMDKGFAASKMKQIYVAKQTTSGSSTT
ncbi:UNVERIFIED_CONTAM: hypothetical protein Slati_1590400 [Sesamum latifolium]|uniref:Uncharacterized protein n=1 Tax=Sesamum latifolium TaxID=2727402 RepID=A0AAW2X882_9LAMI